KFRGESKLSTYLFRIFQRRCIDLLRIKTTHEENWNYEYPAHLRVTDPGPARQLEIRESAEALLALMEELGDTCRKVLKDWAWYGYSMEEIAQRAGLKDARNAASKKYNCLQQLKRRIADRRKQP
ncbi:MAG: sigma-70 family RNA polymerase sigma factor, partial [Bacteroidota bacterium]